LWKACVYISLKVQKRKQLSNIIAPLELYHLHLTTTRPHQHVKFAKPKSVFYIAISQTKSTILNQTAENVSLMSAFFFKKKKLKKIAI
jgi:hypothetical protein